MKRKRFRVNSRKNEQTFFLEILGYEVNLGTPGIRWFVYRDDDKDHRKKPWSITEYNTGLCLLRARTMGEAIINALEKTRKDNYMKVIVDSLKQKGRANPDVDGVFESFLTEWEIAR